MKLRPGNLINYFDQSGRCRFNTLKGFFLQDLAQITHVTAKGNYSLIHLVSGEQKLVTQTLASTQGAIEKYGFERIGRSIMINLNYLSQVDRSKGVCVLDFPSGSLKVELSNRHIKKLSDLFVS